MNASGYRSRKPILNPCKACGIRWIANAETQMCRRCHKAAVQWAQQQMKRDDEADAKAEARARLERPERPTRTVVVRGVEYEVVWDGSKP